MAPPSPRTLLEREGTLGEILPEFFRQDLPPLLEHGRSQRIHLLITTVTGHHLEQAELQGSFYRQARSDSPPSFLWKGSGPLDTVLRQFRLDFLRHLQTVDLTSSVLLRISAPLERAAWGAAEPTEASSSTRPPMGAPPPRPQAELLEEFHPAAAFISRAAAPEAEPVPQQVVPSSTPPALPVAPVPADWRNASWRTKDPLTASPAPAHTLESVSLPARNPEPEREPLAEVIPVPTKESPFVASPAPAPPHVLTHAPETTHHAPPLATAPAALAGHGSLALPGNFYQEYFGFEQMPFNNTPDSHFFFPTEKHREALSRLIWAISERKGFVMISGEIGSGKSTLCRTLLGQLPNDVITALITHTHIDARQLIKAIAEDLHIDTTGLNHYEIHQRLREFLIEQMAASCTVVVIIDEAQNLSPEALEEVRMVSNLETEQEKLIQLILLGQPELRDKLRLPEMRQLRQRLASQFHLEPLGRDEAIGYINHRLQVANPTMGLEFTRRAMLEVFRYTGGVPRLINTLCDTALLTAFGREQRRIDHRLIRDAARDMELEPRRGALAEFFRVW